MSWKIKVPATTANIGAGFDSIGIALSLYLTLTVERAEKWTFSLLSDYLKDLPTDESNLIYQIARKTADRYQVDHLPACHVEVESDIPLARGLGSSSTAIVAGIELANKLVNLNLTDDEKVLLATEFEGQPDNVAPAILGGCVIGHFDQSVETIRIPIEDLTFVAIVPDYELKTKDARGVLPELLTLAESVKASSVANVTVAALCQQNWPVLGKMVEKDIFHQPYRKKLIPHYQAVQTELKEDVFGVYLSGAGPTMMALASKEQVDKHLSRWRQSYPDLNWLVLDPVNIGMTIKEL